MIRSAKEEREIIANGNACDGSLDRKEFGEWSRAIGYLACLEGPEVKALVEALEIIATGHVQEPHAVARISLSKYREAVGK